MWIALLLLLSVDRLDDRIAIVKAVTAIHEPAGSAPVWSESLPTHYRVRSIRFLFADEAEVDAIEWRIAIFTRRFFVSIRVARHVGSAEWSPASPMVSVPAVPSPAPR